MHRISPQKVENNSSNPRVFASTALCDMCLKVIEEQLVKFCSISPITTKKTRNPIKYYKKGLQYFIEASSFVKLLLDHGPSYDLQRNVRTLTYLQSFKLNAIIGENHIDVRTFSDEDLRECLEFISYLPRKEQRASLRILCHNFDQRLLKTNTRHQSIKKSLNFNCICSDVNCHTSEYFQMEAIKTERSDSQVISKNSRVLYNTTLYRNSNARPSKQLEIFVTTILGLNFKNFDVQFNLISSEKCKKPYKVKNTATALFHKLVNTSRSSLQILEKLHLLFEPNMASHSAFVLTLGILKQLREISIYNDYDMSLIFSNCKELGICNRKITKLLVKCSSNNFVHFDNALKVLPNLKKLSMKMNRMETETFFDFLADKLPDCFITEFAMDATLGSTFSNENLLGLKRISDRIVELTLCASNAKTVTSFLNICSNLTVFRLHYDGNFSKFDTEDFIPKTRLQKMYLNNEDLFFHYIRDWLLNLIRASPDLEELDISGDCGCLDEEVFAKFREFFEELSENEFLHFHKKHIRAAGISSGYQMRFSKFDTMNELSHGTADSFEYIADSCIVAIDVSTNVVPKQELID